jgi:hypothetical protein
VPEGQDTFDWAEDLPEGCPPADANPPDNREFYRLVDTIPPTQPDFHSNAKLRQRHGLGPDECINRACSLWNTRRQCEKQTAFPTLKMKKVVKLTLTAESGLVLRTHRSSPGHHSWWRAEAFDPCAHWSTP